MVEALRSAIFVYQVDVWSFNISVIEASNEVDRSARYINDLLPYARSTTQPLWGCGQALMGQVIIKTTCTSRSAWA